MYIQAPEKYLPAPLQRVFQAIREGKFGERALLLELISTISSNNDHYLIGADFESYIECQNQVHFI
jgi:glucan phosphorylase